jgi:hypothetical protein
MMSLQDVIDAAVTCPERYGDIWFETYQGHYIRAVCPLAQEVLAAYVGTEFGALGDWSGLAARALEIPVEHVHAFLGWWDHRNPRAVDILRLAGYRVP